MLTNLFTTFILGFLSIQAVEAASYDTLPKGVNTLVFKQVLTSEIKSQFNSKGEDTTLSLKEEFTSSRLQDVSEVIKSYFEQLENLSPEAGNNFSLGEFSADAKAFVTAQGFGYGHGITDKFTVYASVPIYHIKTDIKFRQTKKSNLASIQEMVKKATPNSAIAKFVKDLTLQLPDSNTEILQSLVVNYYGYQPIGKWEKDSLGDSEIGFIYRLTDYSDKGAAISAGIVVPTGDPDNPDSLQDVSTGDGQYDTFFESAAGISFLNKTLEFDLKGRYTYQFASNKEIRWIDDADLPLSQTKKSVEEKLGNKIDAAFSFTINPTHWFNLNTSFLYAKTNGTIYPNIKETNVKKALEEDTASNAQWFRVGFGFSSVEAYKRKYFEMPFEIGITAQRLLNAKNNANYDRVDLDLKLYF